MDAIETKEEEVTVTQTVVEAIPAAPAAPVSAAKEPGLIRALLGCMFPYILNIVITCGLIGGYDYFLAQKIVAMDIKGFISQQRDLYVTGQIDSEKFKQNVDRMEQVVTSIRPNQVALMGDAVIRNAKVIDIYEPQPTKK